MTALAHRPAGPRPVPPFGVYLPDGDGPALCRRFCSRLKAGGAPLPGGSADGIALCRLYCRGFARGVPTIAARRPHGREGAF